PNPTATPALYTPSLHDALPILVRLKPLVLKEAETIAWLIEAALRYGGRSVSVQALSSLAVLYPFVLDQPLGYLASQSPNLALQAQGPGSQVVGLRTED